MVIRIALMIVGSLLLDQGTKWVVEENMRLGDSIKIIPDIFHFTYIINRGAAFGVLENQRIFFILAALLMSGCGLWALWKFRHYGCFFIYGVAGMIGGAIGNLLDRIRLSGVVDFLDFRIWPIFNIADIFIVCGSMAIIWSFWLEEKKERMIE